MRIEYSKVFLEQFQRCPENIQDAFRIRLEIFIHSAFAPILNHHPLNGQLKGYRSINISGDWRAIFRIIRVEDVAYFIAIGTHNQLYGR
jgi:addiction module RelE/StbE family toxin